MYARRIEWIIAVADAQGKVPLAAPSPMSRRSTRPSRYPRAAAFEEAASENPELDVPVLRASEFLGTDRTLMALAGLYESWRSAGGRTSAQLRDQQSPLLPEW
jgi:hypothetical protein